MSNPTQVPTPTPTTRPEERGAGAGAVASPTAGEAPTVVREYWVEEEHTNYRVVWTEDGVEVSITHYPIYPYSNYIKHVLRVYYQDGNVCLNVYGVRMNWYGTGRDNILDLCFNDYSTESPIFLWRSEIEDIESAEDVKSYVRGISEWFANLMREVSETMLGR